MARISLSPILPLCRGAHQLGVRWNTVRCPAVLATSWMVCTPVAPVPITATRLPSKLTGSCGQRAVWQDWPLKLSMPLILGMVGADNGPVGGDRKGEPLGGAPP